MLQQRKRVHICSLLKTATAAERHCMSQSICQSQLTSWSQSRKELYRFSLSLSLSLMYINIPATIRVVAPTSVRCITQTTALLVQPKSVITQSTALLVQPMSV